MPDPVNVAGFEQSSGGFIKRLSIIVILLNLLVYSFVAFTLHQSRARYEDQASVATQNLAAVLKHTIEREVGIIDMALIAVKYEVEGEITKGGITREYLNRYIARQHSHIPTLQGLRMTDSLGNIIYGTGLPSGPAINIADRDYFIYQRDNPAAGIFISKPILGRVSKMWNVNITRRINKPDGSFAGIVFGSLPLEHLIKTFSSIDVGKKGSVLLRDGDMALIARYPEIPNTIGSKGVTKEFSDLVKSGKTSATFRARAGIDNIERLISFQKLSDYQLYVFVTLSKDEYFSAWRKELPTRLSLAAFFTLVTVISSRRLINGWKREKEGEARLRTVNDELEQRVEQRTVDIKRVNEQLTKELALIESLLRNSPAGIRVFDAESGDCVLVNQSAVDISGGSHDALLAQNFRHIESWEASGLLAAAEQVIADGTTRSIETTLTTSFNREVAVVYQLSRFIVFDQVNLLVIGRDISEEKRLGEEKRRMEEQLLHAQKLESLGVLAGGIAHDFNNILTAIIGNADLALMRLNPESPVIENLHRIEKAAGRASELAKQMLAYSGKGRFVIESINLNRLVEEMLHMLEVSISKKAILRLNLHKPLPTVDADATQLRQIIMNLVINASEAIGDKSGVIAITSGCLECDRNYLQDVWLDENLNDGLYVFLEIADSGCGMDKETMTKIFDPFFTTKFTGRGLGMAAVLGIVRGHKGAIKVYSEPGKGSSFKILLPASNRPEEIFTSANGNSHWKGSGTVLLVDDEETIRALGSEMLRELGFQVLTAEDGRHALEVFSQHSDITCVILDLTMPRMDGEQAFRELRRMRPEIKVIMSSGYNEQEVTQKFMGKELAGFIQKPYTLSRIQEVMSAMSI